MRCRLQLCDTGFGVRQWKVVAGIADVAERQLRAAGGHLGQGDGDESAPSTGSAALSSCDRDAFRRAHVRLSTERVAV